MSERTTLEIIAPTVEEALEQGLSQLGLTADAVSVEVLDSGSKGLFGLGGRQVRVRLSVNPPPGSEPAAPLEPKSAPAKKADSAQKAREPKKSREDNKPRVEKKTEEKPVPAPTRKIDEFNDPLLNT
ncbi:MAG TPA: Jag N-terminal domain-containing protein, partial [Flavisolibacter sp.]|nr:Jag N-terminal domain-containing protein [Flavisolibacter sp.]